MDARSAAQFTSRIAPLSSPKLPGTAVASPATAARLTFDSQERL
jgi:hypothetical protein